MLFGVRNVDCSTVLKASCSKSVIKRKLKGKILLMMLSHWNKLLRYNLPTNQALSLGHNSINLLNHSDNHNEKGEMLHLIPS